MSEQNNLLPSFWNFKLDLIDAIGFDTPFLSISKLPQSYGLHLLGAIWFYTLLVNRKQDVSQVYTVIKDGIEKISEPEGSIFKKGLENVSHRFLNLKTFFGIQRMLPLTKSGINSGKLHFY